jgi:hypothetical protein
MWSRNVGPNLVMLTMNFLKPKDLLQIWTLIFFVMIPIRCLLEDVTQK